MDVVELEIVEECEVARRSFGPLPSSPRGNSQFQGTWKASEYQNAKVDDLLRKTRTTLTQADRQPLYQEATRLSESNCSSRRV